MENSQEQSIENIMANANQYRDELIEKIKAKVAELQMILAEIQENNNVVIKYYLERAKEYDVGYVADKGIIEYLSWWIENLDIVAQKLSELNLDEENIFDQDIYLQRAQELLDSLDDKLKKEENKFAKSNMERFEEACRRKRETEIELANLEIELERLIGEKAQLNQENAEIQSKIDKIKLRFLKRRTIERNKSVISLNNESAEDIAEKIKTLNDRIKELKKMQIKNYFISNSREVEQGNEENTSLEETKEEIEPGKE